MRGFRTPSAPPRAAGSCARHCFAIAIGLLGVVGLAISASAQTPPAASAIARTVVAGTKLASLGDTPLYFRAVSISIPPGQKISFSARPNGILYQLSGSTEVSAGEPKTITGGAGVLIADGTTASLTAGNGEPSILLYFLLVPQEALDQPVAATPATVNELYRTAAPLPELKPGSYELNLTRVTFPPGMPSLDDTPAGAQPPAPDARAWISPDSPLEGAGFEPSVPLWRTGQTENLVSFTSDRWSESLRLRDRVCIP